MTFFKRLSLLVAGVVLSLATTLAHADLKVFATVPEWGALAETMGGDKVKVFTATTGLQDPHRIQARPSLIARARTANLVIATGGFSHLFASEGLFDAVVPDLILVGLREALRLNTP